MFGMDNSQTSQATVSGWSIASSIFSSKLTHGFLSIAAAALGGYCAKYASDEQSRQFGAGLSMLGLYGLGHSIARHRNALTQETKLYKIKKEAYKWGADHGIGNTMRNYLNTQQNFTRQVTYELHRKTLSQNALNLQADILDNVMKEYKQNIKIRMS